MKKVVHKTAQVKMDDCSQYCPAIKRNFCWFHEEVNVEGEVIRKPLSRIFFPE